MNFSPTPHPDVNEVLTRFLKDVKVVLDNQFVGMYLFGSLAYGSFDRNSDIDVLIVVEDEITQDIFSALYAMHEQIAKVDSPWAYQLEVSYVPKDALRRYDPSNNRHPHLDRDQGEKLHIASHDSDWVIQRHILCERGLSVVGPDPKTLIDPVSPQDLKWAVSDIMNGWIKGFLDDPHILWNRGYQAYTVLTLCRILYTFEHGTIVSKPAAAEWAKRVLPPEWSPLIERAWLGRQHPGLKPDPEDVDRTLDFIRYTSKRLA